MFRITASAFLFILSLIVNASGGAQVFTSGSFEGLKGTDGGVLIPPVYDALGWSDGTKELVNEAIGYYENGKWGLINARNKRITPPKYAVLTAYNNQYVKAALKGQFTNHLYHGLLDTEGKALIDFHYFSIEKWAGEMHLVSEYREGRIYYGTCDAAGKVKIPLQFTALHLLGKLTVAMNRDGSKTLFGADGVPVFHESLESVTQKDGAILVSRKGQVGWVSVDGAVIHQIEYKEVVAGQAVRFPGWEIRSLTGSNSKHVRCDSISTGENGILIAHLNRVEQFLEGSDLLLDKNQNDLKYIGNGFMITRNKESTQWALYKTDGKAVADHYDSIAMEGSYFYCLSAKGWDIYNLFGRKINSWPYENLGRSHDRKIPARKNGYWGWIDPEGNQLINHKYDQVMSSENSYFFLAKYVGNWGVADFSDVFLVSPRYDRVRSEGGLFITERGQGTTVFDQKGTEIYRSAATFSGGSSPLTFREGDKWGLILANQMVFEPQYDSVLKVGNFLKVYSGGFVSLLNADGSYVCSFSQNIQDAYSFSEGYFHIKKDGLHGFVDTLGRLRIANRYEAATPFSDSLAAVMLRGKWGLIDKSEKLVIQPFYNEIGLFSADHAVVRQKEFYGLIRKDGKEILPVEWREIRRLPTGNYLLTDLKGQKGLADQKGRILLMPAFSMIKDTEEGLVIASQGSKMGVMDYKGYTKVPFEYSKIEIKGGYLLLLK